MSLRKCIVLGAAASALALGCTAFKDPSEILPPGCNSHKDCQESNGATFVCSPDSTCIDTRQFGCELFDPRDLALEDRDPILVGSLIPKSATQIDTYISRENAIRMAFQEINANGPIYDNRKLVLVACSDDGNADVGRTAAEFLVGSVGVVAIIGPAFSSVFEEVVTNVTADADVFTISMAATRSGLGQLADNGLGWRTAASDAFQSAAIGQLVGALPSVSGSNVVTVYRDDPYGSNLATEIGADGVLPSGTVYNTIDFANGATDFTAAVANANSLNPNVVIIAAGLEVVPILQAFDKAGSSGVTFILSDAGKITELLSAARSFSDIQPNQVFGIDPQVATQGVTDLFTQNFQDNPAFTGAPANYAAHAYDAAYVTAYGIAAIQSGDVTGSAIASNMGMLTSGQPVNVTPDAISTTLGVLREGATGVDLTGASGNLDFDLATGDVPPAYGVWDLQSTPSGAVFFGPAGVWGEETGWTLR